MKEQLKSRESKRINKIVNQKKLNIKLLGKQRENEIPKTIQLSINVFIKL